MQSLDVAFSSFIPAEWWAQDAKVTWPLGLR